MSPKLSIVVPIYNESQTIRNLLNKILQIQQEKEIIVVDDGSTDETPKILASFKHSDVQVLRHPLNRGKGAAVRTGLSHCTGGIVVIQDADLDQDHDVIYQLVKPVLNDGAQMVYGSRFLGERPRMKQANFFANKFLSFLTRFLYQADITDVETCFKAFRADVIQSIALEGNGFEFEVEITAKALKKGFKIKEVPIKQEWYEENYHESKKLHWTDGVKAVITLLKYRLFS